MATVATSGDYDDLTNKPTIPAAQVNADWNAASGVAQILNKPTIPDAQIQSDWNQTTTTAKDYIKNKPTIPDVTTKADKVSNATNGNFASLDSNGNLADSGHKHSDYLTQHQSLSGYATETWVGQQGYLTQHQDISGKADKVVVVDASTLPASLDPNKVYQMGTLTGSVTIPAFSAVASGDTEAKIWCFTFSTGSTAPTITWPAGITGWSGGSAPTISASKSYEVSVMNGIAVIIEV